MGRTDNYLNVKALTETRTDEAKQIRRETKYKDYSPRRGKKLIERKDDLMNTITSTKTAEQLVSVTQRGRGKNNGGDHDECPTISASGFQYNNHLMYAMGSAKPGRSCIGSQRVPEIGNNESSIRRLTEIECERLQGYEDDWTKFGDYNGVIKEVSSTQRYKCIGNAVSVDVVQHVAERIKQAGLLA